MVEIAKERGKADDRGRYQNGSRGMAHIGMPLVGPLGKGLWEVRSTLSNTIARVLFVMHEGQMVLVHGFIKKTQKTPSQDLETGLKRAKEVWRG